MQVSFADQQVTLRRTRNLTQSGKYRYFLRYISALKVMGIPVIVRLF